MCDIFKDDDFIDEDSFEDSLEGEMDETFAADTKLDEEPIEAESQDNDLSVDPFIRGGAMGFAYSEGLRERKRRERKRFGDDSD
jgi:hypothetical protein